jgi:hypothetical protein
MSRSAVSSLVSPRVFQLYSPRRPSPLGLPPLAPHYDSQDIPCSAYPKTPERYYYQHSESTPTSRGMRFPPDVHRRTPQRARASPPAPLSLDTQYHPAAAAVHHLPSIEETLQPRDTQEMRVPPSPTPSSTSSLSLYSAESAKKSSEIGKEGEGGGSKKGGGGGFCLCFSAFLFYLFYSLYVSIILLPFFFLYPDFSALFGTKSKPNKILAPQLQAQVLAAEPAPAPQMVQHRRRPPSLVLVR